MKKFNGGDVVRLKSGGPKMAVQGETTRNEIICKWFVNSEVKKGVFSPKSLELAEDEE